MDDDGDGSHHIVGNGKEDCNGDDCGGNIGFNFWRDWKVEPKESGQSLCLLWLVVNGSLVGQLSKTKLFISLIILVRW